MKRKMYTQLATTCLVTGAMICGGSAIAGAGEVKAGSDKASVSLYGQISRAVMFADDGKVDNVFHVDNDHSGTRIGIKAKAAPQDYLTIGAKFEVEWQSNASNKVTMGDESKAGAFGERHMDLSFDFKNIGVISMGRGDMASNGTSEIDLSGTSLIGYSGVADCGGALQFLETTTQTYSGIAVGDVFDQMDGLSRRNRIRYDTPQLVGFTLGLSAGEDNRNDAAITYEAKFGETKLGAAIAYSNPGIGKRFSQINGSASVLLGFGLNFTVATGKMDMDNLPALSDDPSFMYGKVGFKADLTSVGSTAFSVDYGKFQDIDTMNIDQEATAYGLQVVQKISDYSTELYAGYRNFDLEDNTGAQYDNIDIITAGARIKF